MSDVWDEVDLAGARDALIEAAVRCRDQQRWIDDVSYLDEPDHLTEALNKWTEQRMADLIADLDKAVYQYLETTYRGLMRGQVDAAESS